VRSSPAFASLALELPPVTVADRAAAGLATVAGLYGAAVLVGPGGWLVASGVACAGALATAMQVRHGFRLRRSPALRLERCADGTLQVRAGGGPAVPVAIGRGTRRLGPSVYLDLRFALGGRRTAYRRWLTPLDVPGVVLRRWSVVLPRSGRAACS
jgi:hypothetical protein